MGVGATNFFLVRLSRERSLRRTIALKSTRHQDYGAQKCVWKGFTMLKTLRIATILTGVSAFAIPALAQTADEPIVPGSQASVEESQEAARENVVQQSDIDLAQPTNPAANPAGETIVPGSEAQLDQNQALERQNVAAESDIDLSRSANPAADVTSETIVPGSEAQMDQNEAEVRQSIAAGNKGIISGEGDNALVPGSGGTLAPEAETSVQ
ncbi:hypothetical protein FP2506_08656 [Fulvimarina pelagi HTCC2506]|uniref:Uncharacterized protein n=2 Tax=Fulvimarina pelagi TaxID=217511 RepID=Q0G615_9HYPH|nr:hypothetical protein FP2506_08656 [Fulvimarina pelagi HTCC2506]